MASLRVRGAWLQWLASGCEGAWWVACHWVSPSAGGGERQAQRQRCCR